MAKAKGTKRTGKSKRPATKKASASTRPAFLTEPTADEAIAEAGEELAIEPPAAQAESMGRYGPYPTQTDFVQAHRTLLPKAAVKLAKEKYGFDITPDYFSQTKHRLKGKKKAGAKKKATGNGRSKANGQGAKRTKSASIRASVEAQFTSLLKRIGIDRASEILAAYKAE
jgi:hypothetical protein